MTEQEKIEQIALLFEEDTSTIKPETKLDDLIFDSVVKMSLIVLLSDNFDKLIGVAEINELKTIQDILNLMQS